LLPYGFRGAWPVVIIIIIIIGGRVDGWVE